MTYKVLFIFTVCFNVPSPFKFKVGLFSYGCAMQNLQAVLQRVILLIFSKSVFSLWFSNCLCCVGISLPFLCSFGTSSHATLHNRTSRSQINHSLNLFWLPLLLLLCFSVNRSLEKRWLCFGFDLWLYGDSELLTISWVGKEGKNYSGVLVFLSERAESPAALLWMASTAVSSWKNLSLIGAGTTVL